MEVTERYGAVDLARRPPRSPDRGRMRTARLARFAPPYRDLIAGLTSAAPQADDLTETFPALLFALVTGYGTPTRRERAFRLVLDGGSLKDAAAALGVPLWLRRLPPEAFAVRLPELPKDPAFAVRIANHVPDAVEGAREWLEEVALAAELADGSFALWTARQAHLVPASRRGLLFLLIAAWQWYGNHPGTTGHRLIDQAWSAKMGLRRARDEMNNWRRRAELACLIGEGIESSWLEAGHAGGYDFVPLMTLDDFLEESRVMHNCLDQYADRLATGMVRIFSIRRKGKPVADVEVGPMSREQRRPHVVQLKAARNRRVPATVRAATEEWFDGQSLSRLPLRPGPVRSQTEEQARYEFWAPFLEALPAHQRSQITAQVLAGAGHGMSRNRSVPHRGASPPAYDHGRNGRT